MNQTVELLTLLYELSLTNLQYDTPTETAKNFIQTLLSRKSLHAGGAWMMMDHTEEDILLEKIYSIPEFGSKASISKSSFDSSLAVNDFIVANRSMLKGNDLKGLFAYFRLGEFGLIELYHNGTGNVKFTRQSFLPFLDVVSQLAQRLENLFSHERLKEEIRHRKSAEASLRANEEKFRRIIDNIELGLLEVDNDEYIQYANRPFLDLMGYNLSEIVGRNASDLLLDSAEYKGKVKQQNDERKNGKMSSYEIRVKDKEGNQKWAIVSGAPNYDKDGNLIGSIGIHLDITEEKKLRKENEFRNTQLQKIFEKSLDAVISINAKGEIMEWSPQAEVIFGYEREEVIGKKLSQTIVPDIYREAHDKGMSHYLKTGVGPVLNQRIEIPALRKSQEEFPIELTVFPLKYNEDHYFTAFVRDITEIKESRETMEKALERQKELNSMKSQFISMTSHELRTPLTTIRSNTELLTYQIDNVENLNREKLAKNVQRIDHNVDRLNQLINNILMIGKIDTEKVPFDPVPTDVFKMIKQDLLPDFHTRNHNVACHKQGNPRPVELDEKLFTQIMINLIENAIKYTPSDTPPEVDLTYHDQQLEIHIKDHGIGIPEEDQKKLFQTFFRASNVGNIQGTGLGLAIVKQFVELHGGEIKVESVVQKGTTFKLFFPILNT